MLNRVRTGVLIGIGLIAVAVGCLVLVEGPEDLFAMACFGPGDTRYAPGYSDSGFRELRPGDTEDRVRLILGEPLHRVRLESSNTEVWRYTDSPSDTHYHLRALRFDEKGRLVEKQAEFYVD